LARNKNKRVINLRSFLELGANAADLVTARGHSVETVRERRRLIISRVQMIAGSLSALTALWALVDLATISWPLSGIIIAERFATSLALCALALVRIKSGGDESARRANLMLAGLVLTLIAFLASSYVAFASFPRFERPVFAEVSYFYAPFLLAAGLSVFPLTALESATLAAPIFLTMILSIYLSQESLSSGSTAATTLRLLLMLAIAALAGMSQLRFLIRLTRRAAYDRMTRALTRSAGEQALDLQFAIDQSHGDPFTILFIDLDHFKSINDRFGHDVGDTVLQDTAQSLHASMRRQDVLVRWGGEEFLLLLPRTDEAGALALLSRISAHGLARLPDGRQVTASIGIAERIKDNVVDSEHLVKLADQRMYSAKRSGRNCYVSDQLPAGALIPLDAVKAA
jgi:diguanylate cyclase (GGDEF)-like protein